MQLVNEKLITVLYNHKVNAGRYFILLSFFSNRDVAGIYFDYFLDAQANLDALVEAGYLALYRADKEVIPSNLNLTDLGKQFIRECLIALGQKSEVSGVDDWIDEYREIFAPAKFSMGRNIKGDKKNCIKKMLVFLNDYPEYDKTTILEAAKRYMNRQRFLGYKAVSCADYFISKDKSGSMLASECEELLKKGTTKEVDFNHDI